MRQIHSFLLFTCCVLAFTACKRSEKLCGDATAPNPVSAPSVENLPGAARITYTLPNNSNLLYVRAEYQLNGKTAEAKSSMYTNSILVEGFGDVSPRSVKLYAVNRCEIASTPIEVTINPQIPAVRSVFGTINVIPTFGGINVSYQNPTKANLVYGVLVKDSLGFWQHVDFFYSGLAAGDFNVRGFKQNPIGQPQIKYKFGVYIRDRWDNHSDTLQVELEPVYEEQLDKTKFKDIRSSNYPIPQVAPLPSSGAPIVNAVDYSSSYPLKNLWDNNVGSMFHTKEKVDLPIWMPIDLDQTGASKFKLSRFKIWQRPSKTSYNFNHGNPHQWEIWGTNNPTVASSWVKLGDYTMIKPSGLPIGQTSTEDDELVTNGQEYDFPAGIPAVRYIAWKHIDSWGNMGGYTGFVHMMELTLWGQKQ